MARISDGLSRELAELSTILLAEEHLDDTLDRVARLAVGAIRGCDGAGITLILDSRAVTSAHTDRLTAEIDSIQYVADEGPCLEAIRKSTTFLIDSISTEQRWPQFCVRAARKGISSCLSLPLRVRDKTLGALNLYSRGENGFAHEERMIGSMIAAQAETALSYAELYQSSVKLSEQLFEALDSRPTIDQAKGILMAQEHCSQEEAFAMLVDASYGLEEELVNVAQQVVDSIAYRKQQP
jgi:GAF domain-containing protein